MDRSQPRARVRVKMALDCKGDNKVRAEEIEG